MSDANRTILRYVEEVAWGEVPAGPPTFTNLRETGEGLKGTKQTEVSEEIRSDRQIPGIIRTGIGAEGDLNFELSYASYDPFFLAVLMASAFSASVSVASGVAVTVAAAAGTFTLGAGTWDNTPSVGEWVRFRGFPTNAGNNGVFKVSAASATVITVSNKDGLVDEAGVTINAETAKQAVNGVAEKSFSIEREHTDLTNIFELYRGLMPASMSLEIPVDGRITGSFSFMGKDEQATTATAGDGSPNAANDNEILSSANNIRWINISHGSVCLFSGTIEVTNNLREIRCAGELSPHDLGIGRFAVTGDLELLFQDHTQKSRYLAHTEAGFAVAIQATDGAVIVFEVPSFQMSDDETVAGGVDTELVESISFEAFMNATEDITMRIALFDAP